MPRFDFSSLDRFSALAALAQSRSLEWFAAATQVLMMEVAQRRREWQQLGELQEVLGIGGAILAAPALEAADAFQLWGRWCVRQQLALSQALMVVFPVGALSFNHISGRRSGTDPGRRRSAVVIDFPDRRRPNPTDGPKPMG